MYIRDEHERHSIPAAMPTCTFVNNNNYYQKLQTFYANHIPFIYVQTKLLILPQDFFEFAGGFTRI